jgi:hypothetical protein
MVCSTIMFPSSFHYLTYPNAWSSFLNPLSLKYGGVNITHTRARAHPYTTHTISHHTHVYTPHTCTHHTHHTCTHTTLTYTPHPHTPYMHTQPMCTPHNTRTHHTHKLRKINTNSTVSGKIDMWQEQYI